MSLKKVKEFFALEKNIVVFALSNIVLLAGMFVYMNFLPKFYEALGASTLIVGLLFTLGNGVQQVSHLIGGYWSDRYGRKKIYLLSFSGALSLVIFYFSPSWIFLVPAVLLIGFTDGIGGTAGSTIITESVSKRKRATGLSIVQSVATLTVFVTAPFGGLLIEKFGFLSGFKFGLLTAISTSIIAFVFVSLFLKETLKKRIIRKTKFTLKSGISFFTKLPSKIKSYFLFASLLFFGMSLVQPFFIFYALDIVRINAFEFSILMTVMTGVSSLFLIAGGKLSDISGRKRVLLMSVFLTALASLVFLLSKSFANLVFFAILDGIAMIGFSSLIPYVADHVKANIRAKSLGLINFILMLSATPGPLIGGWLYSIAPTYPFIVLIGISVLTFFVGWKVLQ